MGVLNFKGSWRAYQKRILDDLAFHLADNKIHVVAAPGAGKTTLGIEVIAQINKPTLILTPTVTIRNQWRQRIEDAFLNENAENIVSVNIKNPKFITVITYQALLTAFCGSKDSEEDSEENLECEPNYDEDKITSSKRFKMNKADGIIQLLASKNVKLLCFDEAHHLRNEWWKALDYLRENLNPEQTVALTATPPYDSKEKEWERYENLCGTVDEIISIPELVSNGDLCPHQDFIHFSLMRKHETEKIKEQINKVDNYLKNLLKNNSLIKIILNELQNESEETILDNPKLYISIMAFLKTANQDIPKEILKLFDLNPLQLPRFKNEYQKLFLAYVFGLKDKLKNPMEVRIITELLKSAKEAEILQNKTIFLNDSPRIKRRIANSTGKLDSIKKIVDTEAKALTESLRMVILADYIKYDNFDASELGVIPIWQVLKERKDISLAVLTGSVILIPTRLENILAEFLKKSSLEDSVTIAEFERDKNFIKINAKGSKKSYIVELITQMFNQGYITVMVGTQALLGEGWDAPAINSLILSSTVSSYMLSNQMRGRAIRIDKNNPGKISNIWHLASIRIMSETEQFIQNLTFSSVDSTDNAMPAIDLSDFNQLCQRFKGYQAPSTNAPYYIESGIERILPKNFKNCILTEDKFMSLNIIMEQNAKNRRKTKELWDIGTIQSYNAPIKELRDGCLSKIKEKDFYYRNGYYTQLITWGLVWIVLADICMPTILKMFDFKTILTALLLFFIGFCISVAKPTIKYLQCSSPEKIMRQIGIVFLETLSAMGKIKTALNNISIHCKTDAADGSIFFSVSNLSPEENNLLINSVIEFINPVENPRYLFIRKDKVLNYIDTTDYHSMPSVISNNKNNINIFKKLWQKYIGKCDIIYTRTQNGRRQLLKARKNSFSDLVRSPKAQKLSRFE